MADIPAIESRNPAELIEYQENSVVSREIMKQKGGTVTLFAFDAGQGLSEHTAPFDAMVFVLEGQAQVIIGGKEYRPKAGEMLIMPANIPHALHAGNRFKMLLVMVKSL